MYKVVEELLRCLTGGLKEMHGSDEAWIWESKVGWFSFKFNGRWIQKREVVG